MRGRSSWGWSPDHQRRAHDEAHADTLALLNVTGCSGRERAEMWLYGGYESIRLCTLCECVYGCEGWLHLQLLDLRIQAWSDGCVSSNGLFSVHYCEKAVLPQHMIHVPVWIPMCSRLCTLLQSEDILPGLVMASGLRTSSARSESDPDENNRRVLWSRRSLNVTPHFSFSSSLSFTLSPNLKMKISCSVGFLQLDICSGDIILTHAKTNNICPSIVGYLCCIKETCPQMGWCESIAW